MRVRTGQDADSREESWADWGLLLARLGFGGSLILRHGIGKIPILLVSPVEFLDPVGLGPFVTLLLAIFAEVVCALGVVLGLFFRLSCVPLIVNFAVIVVVMHRLQVPYEKGELALLYLVAFVVLILTGPGRFSLDHRRKSGQQQQTNSESGSGG